MWTFLNILLIFLQTIHISEVEEALERFEGRGLAMADLLE
jgi:hypothetical protein